MNVPIEKSAIAPAVGEQRLCGARVQGGVPFATALVVLSILFWKPLVGLFQFAGESDLYSYVVLMPFVSVYLIAIRRNQLAQCAFKAAAGRGLAFVVAAFVPLLLFFKGGPWLEWSPSRADTLFLLLSSYLLMVVGCGFLFLGRAVMRAVAFPAAVLFLMLPLPGAVERGIEHFLQSASAGAALVLFNASLTPVLRDGFVFHLPADITLRVAPECSGIRSSLILLITSLVAGHLFLRTIRTRATLALFVIPLGIFRNAVRIFTIGMLCVHVSPDMINSWIHRRGGPVFFLLSLVPFFGLLVFLRSYEGRIVRSQFSGDLPADHRTRTR